MAVENLVNFMNKSLQKVEESVEQMERHKNITKTEQRQIMQAVIELSDRVKLIEMHVNRSKEQKEDNSNKVFLF